MYGNGIQVKMNYCTLTDRLYILHVLDECNGRTKVYNNITQLGMSSI